MTSACRLDFAVGNDRWLVCQHGTHAVAVGAELGDCQGVLELLARRQQLTGMAARAARRKAA